MSYWSMKSMTGLSAIIPSTSRNGLWESHSSMFHHYPANNMDRTELQTIIRFAHIHHMMHKPFAFVLKWYLRTNALDTI